LSVFACFVYDDTTHEIIMVISYVYLWQSKEFKKLLVKVV
jgi:hypothetical protein